MELVNTEQEDEKAGEKEYQGRDRNRSKREPRPEDYAVLLATQYDGVPSVKDTLLEVLLFIKMLSTQQSSRAQPVLATNLRCRAGVRNSL